MILSYLEEDQKKLVKKIDRLSKGLDHTKQELAALQELLTKLRAQK